MSVPVGTKWSTYWKWHFCNSSVASCHSQLPNLLPGLLHRLPGENCGQKLTSLTSQDVKDCSQGCSSNTPTGLWQWAGLPPFPSIGEVQHFCAVQGSGRGVAPCHQQHLCVCQSLDQNVGGSERLPEPPQSCSCHRCETAFPPVVAEAPLMWWLLHIGVE